DKTLKKFEHYKFHEELQCNYSFDSDESAFSNLSGYLSLENPPPPPTLTPTPTSSSSQSTPPPPANPQPLKSSLSPPPQPVIPLLSLPVEMINSKSKSKSSKTNASSQQQFSTFTTIDGMPILKRKRGRPPKNRSNEISTATTTKAKTSKNNSKNRPPTLKQSPSMSSSSFDLARAFNLPLNHAEFLANFSKMKTDNDDDDMDDPSKTIPIPFIMPYIKTSIHNGFYGFDEETLCPIVT
ncbi:hypothetical protein BLA29_007188, partial [Euroglyphus maynei]